MLKFSEWWESILPLKKFSFGEDFRKSSSILIFQKLDTFFHEKDHIVKTLNDYWTILPDKASSIISSWVNCISPSFWVFCQNTNKISCWIYESCSPIAGLIWYILYLYQIFYAWFNLWVKFGYFFVVFFELYALWFHMLCY